MDLENTHEDWEKDIPKHLGVGKENPFTVPENYFKTLTESIEASLAAERLKEIAGNDGFTVPENYFDLLNEKILNKVKVNAEPAITVKLFRTNWIKYAAAACVTFVAAITFYLSNHTKDPIEAGLNQVQDQDIVNYLKVNSDPGDTRFIIENINLDNTFTDIRKEISEEDLEEYINTTNL
ncbi:hypothetical protein [Rubrolithibacter danxiaensis]|uniref:hypothetical protein n=1 Tax=Rubrolithibacter danxiaensis TaxID=3390805 RepID=UPI003BF85F9B